ncbi:GAF domain-containing protein [Phaeovibrio sulfidiphilus]|uniref:histidine kinase n=1 Tax=Phaeovibrio sulfidiphilus TaxID=1220600 RepID=A0A8J7CPQ0_9PROT|nr:GAF domain-containing protein [Phaeovibrio sulfidiphilus]
MTSQTTEQTGKRPPCGLEEAFSIQSHGDFLLADERDCRVLALSRNLYGRLQANGQGHSGPGPGPEAGRPAHPKALFLADLLDEVSLAQCLRRAGHVTRLSPLDPFRLHLADGTACEATVRKVVPSQIMIEMWPAASSRPDPLVPFLFSFGRAPGLNDVQSLCENAVRAVSRLTGYDQVMVFRFTDYGDGDVVAEKLRKTSPLPPFLGGRFPASDVLFNYRDTFSTMPLSAVPDVEAPLQPVLNIGGGPMRAFPPSEAHLAAPPLAWLQYMRGLGVRARLAVAILVDDQPWGLLLCHHPSPRPLDPAVMGAIQVFVRVMAGEIRNLENTESADRRGRLSRLVETLDIRISESTPLEDALAGSLGEILSLFSASDGLLSLRGRCWTPSGPWDGPKVAFAVDEPLVVTDTFKGLIKVPPDLGPGFAGGILIPLSDQPREDFLLIGRPAIRQSIHWAGLRPSRGASAPRPGNGSFAFSRWEEDQQDRTLPFSSLDHELAHSLRMFLSRRVFEARVRKTDPRSGGEPRSFPPWHESSMDWFWETDKAGRLTDVTKFFEDVEGSSTRPVVGHRLTDFLVVASGGGESSDLEELRSAFSRRAAFHGLTAQLQLPGFDPCWVRLSGFPMIDTRGNLLGYRGAATNVTHLRALQEENIRSQRLEALGRMASGIAHEINNVLQPMLSMSYQAAKRLDDQEYVRAALADIEESGLRAREIVKAILAFGRQAPSDRHAIRIAAELNKALAFACKGIPRLRVDTDIEPTDAEVLANTTELSQVVLNLLTNAADAMGGRGVATVTLRSQKEIGRVRITVRDQGPGMDLTTCNRIFDPFFTTKAEGKGTGMGLAVVHGLVEAWGGTVGVESVVGFGTTFWISLPVIAT